MDVSVQQADFAIDYLDRSCANIDYDGMLSIINALNERKYDLGCAIFPPADDVENVMVIFAGAVEYFHLLRLAVGARCEVIYFQDCQSFWYQGSDILPDLTRIVEEFLIERIGPRRPVFFGQSSGGYAALIAARYFDNSISLLCSPQTFSDNVLKDRIHFFPGVRPLATTSGLIDIVAHWRGADFSRRYVGALYSASEHGNPVDFHFWMDHIHLSRLAEVEGIRIYLTPTDEHGLLHKRARLFATILRDACAIRADEVHEFLTARLTAEGF